MKAKKPVPLESTVETYLVERVEALGGVAEKVQVINRRGFFDRLVLLPGGRVIFCEVKRPRGGVLSPHQRQRIENYRALGAEVAVVKNRDEVDRLLAPP
jgi:hypothetical protein